MADKRKKEYNIDPPPLIESFSGVSLFDGKPFVELRWGKYVTQMRPNNVRELAIALLSAAEAAEHDAALVDFLQTKLDLSRDAAARILGDLREVRSKKGWT